MNLIFTSRRKILGLIAGLPFMAYAQTSFKAKTLHEFANKKDESMPNFVDFLLQQQKYNTSQAAIGQFVVQHSEISKQALVRLTTLQKQLHDLYISQDERQLQAKLGQLIRQDFINYRTLTIEGLVVSETEVTLWALLFATNKRIPCE